MRPELEAEPPNTRTGCANDVPSSILFLDDPSLFRSLSLVASMWFAWHVVYRVAFRATPALIWSQQCSHHITTERNIFAVFCLCWKRQPWLSYRWSNGSKKGMKWRDKNRLVLTFENRGMKRLGLHGLTGDTQKSSIKKLRTVGSYGPYPTSVVQVLEKNQWAWWV